MEMLKLDIQRFAVTNVHIDLEQVSQDIANNYSIVRVSAYETTTNQSHNDYTLTGTYTIDGQSYTFNTTIPLQTTKQLFTADHIIYHNQDGTKTVEASFSLDTRISPYNVISASNSLALTTIPRATPAPTVTGYIGQSTTITISPYINTFRHFVRLYVGNFYREIYMAEGVTSTTYTISTDYYAQMPNASYTQDKVEVSTYDGDTEIGYTQGIFNLYALESECKPTLTYEIVDKNPTTIALTKGEATYSNIIVKNHSNVRVNLTYTARNSATISQAQLQLQTGAIYSMPTGSTTSSGEWTFNAPAFSEFYAYARDSRGFTDTSQLTPTRVINYVDIDGVINFKRPTPTSNKMRYYFDITWWNGIFGRITNAINSYKWRVKEANSSTYTDTWHTFRLVNSYTESGYTGKLVSGNTQTAQWIEIDNPLDQSGEWDYATSYDFEVLIEDRLTSLTPTIRVNKGIPVFDWYEYNDENYFNINGKLLLNNNLSYFNFVDTRYTNELPSYYRNMGTGIYREFKIASNIAITISGMTYVSLFTFVHWIDYTGGNIFQIAMGTNQNDGILNIYTRTGWEYDNGWNTWALVSSTLIA